ncbi:MAG TPA: holo-ACP synthase [Syntrophorhabdaceae bacterium]|nr:holo-ACP synthase [Syntrophorhabdaceae bacterium]
MKVGVDIVDIKRINEILNRHGRRFLHKVFTDEEIGFLKNKKMMAESVAGRFAAKEAFMKAKGRQLPWKDINVLQSQGRPYIHYHGKAYDGLSISHERAYAVAVMVIEE